MPPTAPSLDQSFSALRRFARPRSPVERCELCGAALIHEHPHLLELATRQIVCACEACSTLFDGPNSGKYRRVSRRAWFLPDLKIDDAQWDALLIPINMAFFFYSSVQGRMVTLVSKPGRCGGIVASSRCMERDHSREPSVERTRTGCRSIARESDRPRPRGFCR